jgi:hypothetical protein
MHKETEKKSKPVIAAVIMTLMVLATSAILSMTTTDNVVAYKKNQATSQANACGNIDVPTDAGCQDVTSQIQGEENAVDLAVRQIFRSVAPEPPGGGPPDTCVECFTTS